MSTAFILSRVWRSRVSYARSDRIIHRHHSQLNKRWNFVELDAKWQSRWADSPAPTTARPKSYVLPMFAYPSGSLHMGHLRVYTISDVLARHRRMRGHDVLHPTGWDAFGLPAENAAIQRGVDPGDWTVENIQKMKGQLKSMNTHFDWDAEISTCHPSFYKHTQKLFLTLHKRGLAYQAEALVNYDPVDKTVLANEQVDSSGRSWRSGALVQQIMLRQWFFKITDFQQELLSALDQLAVDNKWPERVLTQQRNWIGQSQGARIQFQVSSNDNTAQSISVFTTRPDTLYGVRYLALSLSHPIIMDLASTLPQLQDFINKRASFAPDSKAGFELPIRAINPASRLSDTESVTMPVFAAPYVLDGYGEGAVMGVPGHDSRDLAFWKQHRPDSSVSIVVSDNSSTNLIPSVSQLASAHTAHGILTSLCGPYANMRSQEGGNKIVDDLSKHGIAERIKTWKLRDWLVSRQRYWGAPIPIIHCTDCGAIPVPDKDLPVELPKLDSSVKGQIGNPLERCEDWVNTSCPSCGGPAKRETDTMDTFVDSSWYYMRFPDAQNELDMFSLESAAANLPVDTYIGGVEHAILHLLYARFIYKFLCQEGLVQNDGKAQEPFSQLIAQGMVHGRTFSDPETGRFLLPHEVDLTSQSEPVITASGKTANISWEKMSKSKHNGVEPSTCIVKYGADATRAHILFAAPVSEILQWDEEKIVGIQRWFQRIATVVSQLASRSVSPGDAVGSRSAPEETSSPLPPTRLDVATMSSVDASAILLTNATIRSVSTTLESNPYALNTYISDLIKLTNHLYSTTSPTDLSLSMNVSCVAALIKLFAPAAPAFAEECWEILTKQYPALVNSTDEPQGGIFTESWPVPLLTVEEEATLKARTGTMTCAVQINGKLRFTIQVPSFPSTSAAATGDTKGTQRGKSGLSEVEEGKIIDAVLSSEDGHVWLKERNDWENRKRVVVVGGGKLVNIVF